jgi:hypothetical protein
MKFQSKSNRSDRRIVICGSMAFYAEMAAMKRQLKKHGIQSVIPDLDSALLEAGREKDYQGVKRRASMRHIRRVRDQKTFAVLVMNLDKHGVHDYIGPNTFAEIAVALAHYKQIYLFQGIPDFYQDELLAWQATFLNGNVSTLVSSFREAQWRESQQLTLFEH